MKRSWLVALAVLLTGCVVDQASDHPSHDHDEALGVARSALTVDQEIAKASCSTSSAVVQGLSQQILDEIALCLKPGVLVKVPSDSKIDNDSVHPYLLKPAYDALKKAAASRADVIHVSSMFRTVVQQYFLWRRSSCYPAVATPGSSNHETGIAIDVSDPDNSTFRSVLGANGFKWLGSFDRFHFDYVGAGAVNLRGQDVLAFQRLWNRNNPGDKIAEDGDWGPQTESRLRKSPAGGFATGADCGPPPPPPVKPWPALEIEAAAEGADRFSDGASTAIVDVMEGDEYLVNLVVRNVGNEVAKDVTLGVWIEEPFVVAVRYDIESDWGHEGTFEINDANARADNPQHDGPGSAFALKINGLSPKETKRVRVKAKAARYSIGLADAPDVRVWVKDVPGVYTKEDFGAKATNVDGRQTYNAGDLKAWAPVDIYSRVRWSFDGGMLEGWNEGGAAEVNAEDESKGLVVTTTGDAPQAIGPETSFAAADWPAIALKASSTLSGPAKIWFTTADAPGFDAARSLDVTLPGSETREVVVRLADHPAWQGTITRLRIDPPAGAGTVAFDEIRMTDGGGIPAPTTPAAAPDGGGGDMAGACGCRTTAGAPSLPALTLMGALAALRRRRRRP
ncbi:MAG: D-alanyl-D-alanine carboxypeptidase family protein [Deltaproteobacteria bacterium]|nr:D-alanyl-D-alanine carboxypeptidase family protein [Deltaproteobacteria bacterium]